MRMALPCWNMRASRAANNVRVPWRFSSWVDDRPLGFASPSSAPLSGRSARSSIYEGQTELSVLAPSTSRSRHVFSPKYTHSPIYKVTLETSREPNSSVVLLDKMSVVEPRAAAWLGCRFLIGPYHTTTASICAAGAHECLGILGLWRFKA